MESMLALQEALAGRYVLERELGRGGMGIVYLAWDTALERLVALKILPPAIATRPRRERFLREARIAARLRHDNIVPIHAVDEAGPFVYYTMEYVRGETLYDRIVTDGPLPVGDVTRILHDVARAVHYAHTQGVIHRDLKPQNILIERESGRPYVADFGLARVMSDRPPAGAGRTFGTFAYMSPEQAAGLPADHRSDIYSLGVVGYVMATGRPLFAGTVKEVLEQHIVTPAPPLPVLGLHLDTTLARAVGRCLAKDPRQRFHSAGELSRALALAPELRTDLPEPLRRFVSRLRLESNKFVGGGLLLGVPALGVLGYALDGGHPGAAAAALGVLGLVLVSPVLNVLAATRRLLRAQHDRADIVHAINVELDQQREQLAKERGRASDATATRGRRIVAIALGLFGAGAVAAASGVDLPEVLVTGSMVVGAFTTFLAGGTLVWRERRRNALWGHRWLAFWQSQLGEWTAKVAGIGLRRVPTEPDPLQPAAVTLPLPDEPARAAPSGSDDVAGVLHLTESCVRRIRACLERQLAVLEALLEKFQSGDAGPTVEESLMADLEAAREVCEAVEGLIAGWEFRA
jgi:serine/threonine-protein kinase